jgi:hypothetical protein
LKPNPSAKDRRNGILTITKRRRARSFIVGPPQIENPKALRGLDQKL